MNIVETVLPFIKNVLGMKSSSSSYEHPLYGKSPDRSLSRGFIDMASSAATAYIDTLRKKDAEKTGDALALTDLPKASAYIGKDIIHSPRTGGIQSYVGANNPKITGAISSLANRGVITDANMEQLFAQARPVAVTTRQGKRTQSLGSTNPKESLKA